MSQSHPVGTEPEVAPDRAVRRRLRQLSEIPVTRITRVGPKKVEALAQVGIETVLDLLTTYPRRYIDRTRQADLADLAVGEEAVVMAEVRGVRGRRTRQGRSMVEVTVHDGTGGMAVVFFNQPWRERQLGRGSQVLLFGKLDSYRGRRQMANPVVDLLVGVEGDPAARERTLRVIPVYPSSAKAGLTSWELGTWIAESLRRAGDLADPLPERWRRELRLHDRTRALRGIHLPETMAQTGPARRRLAFDELFRLQLALVLRRQALEREARGLRHQVSPEEVPPGDRGERRRPDPGATLDATLVERFFGNLPFRLTAAQRRALRELFGDLAGPVPMHRLLQGDVGSGKTVVALATMLASVQGGHQAALMVPTEVLAEQHHLAVGALLGDLSVPDASRLEGVRPVSVALLTSRASTAERSRVLEGLVSGSIDLVVGTHALLTEDVRFRSLGVVVVDEQHRFGVEQRATLRAKGRSADGVGEGWDPDLLVMTATPIPRTAAMVVFGDLAMTVLDELPPGRTPITTVWARTATEEQSLAEVAAWQRVRDEVAAGRRAYVVCPLVEESERVQARSATEEFERLRTEVLPGLTLGLLHGQMGSAEKEAAMRAFRSGATQVLVATTVIEVGVDVPEAAVMVVEDADRFGIAQLHQLRGRVGRGDHPSWCYLLGPDDGEAGARRLEALERTADGFELAEVDLQLRGEGAILGERQKGRSDLKLASLRRDRDLLEEARRVAEAIVAEDPLLARHGILADEVRLFLDDEDAAYLFKS